MGKPDSNETPPAPNPAPQDSTAVIRAQGGKPLDPSAGGRYQRVNGELQLVEALGVPPTPEQRQKRREEQRQAAIAAAKNTKE